MSIGQISYGTPSISPYRFSHEQLFLEKAKTLQNFYEAKIRPFVEKISNLGLAIALVDHAQSVKWIRLGGGLPYLLGFGYVITILTSTSEILKDGLHFAIALWEAKKWDNIDFLNLITHVCMIAWASLRLGSVITGAALAPKLAEALFYSGFSFFLASMIIKFQNKEKAPLENRA